MCKTVVSCLSETWLELVTWQKGVLEHRETYSHLFCECKEAKNLWNQFSEYVQDNFKRTIKNELSTKNIIFNKISQKKADVVNLLCLLTKQYIYKQRCLGKKLSWGKLRKLFLHIENVEKYIAISNGRLNYHTKKGQDDLG